MLTLLLNVVIMKYSLILCGFNFQYEKQQQWRIKGGGAEWAKARNKCRTGIKGPGRELFDGGGPF